MTINRRRFLQITSSAAVLGQVWPERIFASGASADTDFAVRAFEFSGSGMWQWKSIDRALAIMDRLGFNTLILHQNDLPNFIVWPSAYFTTDFMFSHDPVRKSCA